MVRLLKIFQCGRRKTIIDFHIYHGKIDSEEVLGLIDSQENYYNYGDISEVK